MSARVLAPARPGPLACPLAERDVARDVVLVPAVNLAEIREAFSALMPLDRRLERHLRGVLAAVLSRPGSLVRAQIAYAVARRHGFATACALRLATSIEYFHTASLVLDDMPMMGNATARRGAVCPHVVHGEAAATLGALALITRAYALVWDVIDTTASPRRRDAAALVSETLGVSGILDAQARDVYFAAAETSDVADVLDVAAAKTAPLFRLALVLPALLADARDAEIARLERLARLWSVAYQIVDDFKDCLLSDRDTGKSTARDAVLGRPNVALRAGDLDAARRLDELLAHARVLVGTLDGDPWGMALDRLQARLEAERADIIERVGTRTPA